MTVQRRIALLRKAFSKWPRLPREDLDCYVASYVIEIFNVELCKGKIKYDRRTRGLYGE
jgi:hypothetical protein